MNNNYLIEGGVLKEYTGNDAVVIIPEEAHEIGNGNVIKNKETIEKLIITKNVKRMWNNTFSNCSNLKEVEFCHNDNVIISGNYLFTGCPKLKKVSFPDWETYWKFNYDVGGGPLSNGANLYINGKPVDTLTIPYLTERNWSGIRMLEGASGITGIVFENGEKGIGIRYKNDYCPYIVSEKVYAEFVEKYPDYCISINTICDIPQSLKGIDMCFDILFTLEDLELWYFEKVKSEV